MARRCGISVAHRVLGVLGAALILAVAPSPAAQAEEFSLEPGDIVIADSGFDGKIIRVDPVTGTQTVIANGGLLEDPFGIAIDVNGDLLVTDAGAIPAIIRIERATGAQSVLSSGGEFVAPDGIAIDPASGDLVVADRDALTCCGDPPSGAILRVDPATGAQSIVSFGGTVATGESFFNPAGIAIEASGDLLVADFDAFFGPGAIFRVDPASGAQTVVREGPDPSAGFLGIAIDADGQLLVTNAGGADGLGDVFRIDPTTGDQTLVSTGGNLGEPYGIAIDSNGDILVSDSQSQALIRIDPVTGDQTLVSSGGFFLSPRRMVVVRDPEANAVAIDITPGSDPNSINPASTGLSPVAILGSDTFDVLDLDPRLAFGPSGAAPVHRGGPHYEDVNDDDRTDLLAHFDSQETGIAFGDTQACVTGETLEGIPFEACDDIRTVPACGMGLELVILLTPVMWLRNRRRRNPK